MGPLKAPVSGTAMGLIKEGKEVRILTDIQGIEDFLGDMDFKVAGTEKGITALQMDMKITGLPVSIVSDAIKKARPARLHILEKMKEAIEKPQEALSPHAQNEKKKRGIKKEDEGWIKTMIIKNTTIRRES